MHTRYYGAKLLLYGGNGARQDSFFLLVVHVRHYGLYFCLDVGLVSQEQVSSRLDPEAYIPFCLLFSSLHSAQ